MFLALKLCYSIICLHCVALLVTENISGSEYQNRCTLFKQSVN